MQVYGIFTVRYVKESVYGSIFVVFSYSFGVIGLPFYLHVFIKYTMPLG